MPLDWLAARRVVAFVYVGAAELAAGHFAGHSGAVVAVAVADAAGLQLVVAHCVELEPELASEPVVVLVAVRARVPAFVHSDEFAAGLVVDGELD